MKDRLFEIWFALRCGVQNREFRPLLETYGTPYDLYKAEESELESLPCSQGLKAKLADKSLGEATRIMEFCREKGVGILFWQDDDYPVSLRPLRDPPVLLYYKGKLPDLTKKLCVSVVGTRSMSEYGKRVAYKLGYELGAAGTVVVSGMALGNDGVAAAGAILSGGSTVAVLGSGIDVPYPREHGKLFAEIITHGAVMTEFAPGTPPEGRNFPIRNRIISGLSQATVVVEGDLKSGALITARTAILQGRDIYAFPGNVGETNSAGTNQLISDGAAMVLSARDLLENYTFLYGDMLDTSKLNRAETRSHIDEAGLERLGVCVRTEKPKEELPPSPVTPAPRKPHREAPAHSEGGRATRQPAPSRAPVPPASVPARGDASDCALKSLTDAQRKIFEALPLDHAVAIDYFTREGYTVGEIMAAMTVLEIKGLTVTLPGGLYSRK
ncbi:MAG: DNA-processing protein DprA [Clostridia bacterium]|nr:DNA-processing protein DprA [Clostridia bacterium]